METKNGSIMNAGQYDVRQTAAEWIERIEGVSSDAMLLTIAGALSTGNLLKEDENTCSQIKLYLTSSQLVEIALTKYCEVSGSDVVTLMEKIVDSIEKEKKDNPSSPRDLLGLQLSAIDFFVSRRNQRELQDLFIFLNAHRSFIPRDLLRMKMTDIRLAMDEIADTEKIKMQCQGAVSGVICTDK